MADGLETQARAKHNWRKECQCNGAKWYSAILGWVATQIVIIELSSINRGKQMHRQTPKY